MRDIETRGRTDYGNRVAWLSVLSGSLLAVKFLAYQLTGSAAVLSDALESIVNVIASSFALFSVTLSASRLMNHTRTGTAELSFSQQVSKGRSLWRRPLLFL